VTRPPPHWGAYSNGGWHIESNYVVILWVSVFTILRTDQDESPAIALSLLAPLC